MRVNSDVDPPIVGGGRDDGPTPVAWSNYRFERPILNQKVKKSASENNFKWTEEDSTLANYLQVSQIPRDHVHTDLATEASYLSLASLYLRLT